MAKVSVRAVEKALVEKRGNIAAAARSLGVNRSTVYRKVEASPSLQAVLEDARETMLDDAEDELYKQALSGNTPALIFFMKTQGKRRGYTERQELTGADGGPLLVVNWDDATDDTD